MILQSLAQYYERKRDVDADALPDEGWERKEIPFIIVLDEQGNFVDWEDTRENVGKKKRARNFVVPQSVKRSLNVSPNLLWDNAGYVLGVDTKGDADRAKEQHKTFIEHIKNSIQNWELDVAVNSVVTFLENSNYESLFCHERWSEIKESKGNISFKLQGDIGLICERDVVKTAVNNQGYEDSKTGHCLVSGDQDTIARLHPTIKGVWGGQTSGGDIVSFNMNAFNSYGKDQGYNSPVGQKVSFSYTTALNHLLAKDSRQRMQVGDATVVFWAEKDVPLESVLSDLFGEAPKDDPDRNADAVRGAYMAPKLGASPIGDQTKFYILGLAPNSKRLSVRFWHVCTVDDLSKKICRFFQDIEIAVPPKAPQYPSLFRLLTSIAVNADSKNIPPRLGGDVMRAILEGTPYPTTWLNLAVNRAKAERNISPTRAAVIKACLNRLSSTTKEVTVSLDKTNQNQGYVLGRLFAVLERAQEQASPGINATIRDRFYSSASTTPVAAFPFLMKLKNHHLAKLQYKNYFEKMIGEITENISDFPAHLVLADQGQFAIGYYHQRQAFFTKQDDNQGEAQ